MQTEESSEMRARNKPVKAVEFAAPLGASVGSDIYSHIWFYSALGGAHQNKRCRGHFLLNPPAQQDMLCMLWRKGVGVTETSLTYGSFCSLTSIQASTFPMCLLKSMPAILLPQEQGVYQRGKREETELVS